MLHKIFQGKYWNVRVANEMNLKRIIMPICFDKKIIFVHIPKTGGQSIESMFDFKEGKQNFFCRIENELKTIEYTHYTLEMLKKEINVNLFFSFSFIRNPYERLVSQYFFRPKDGPFFKRLNLKKFSFEDFIVGLQQYKMTYLYENFYFECHIMPQYKFLIDTNLKSVDFIGRYENYNKDIEFLMKNLKIDSKLIHKNKTNHNDYRFYYNNETKKIVEYLYKKDLEKFSYIF